MKKGTEIFSLEGKNVLVTGATGYLGGEMASIFAEAGATVFINGRSLERCHALRSKFTGQGLKSEIAAFDVTSQVEVDQFVEYLGQQTIDVLVNNAYFGGAGSIENSTQNSYLDSIDVTLVATHRLVKALLPNLRRARKESGDCSVINVGSMYGIVSPDLRIYGSPEVANPPFYGAAKAALIQWTRYAACEFGQEGIRFNSVTPGPFPSREIQASNPEFIEKLVQKVPLGRIGDAQEIRGPMLFLASSASSFVNGATIAVDGGWTSW